MKHAFPFVLMFSALLLALSWPLAAALDGRVSPQAVALTFVFCGLLTAVARAGLRPGLLR